jgi:hypothetical protein
LKHPILLLTALAFSTICPAQTDPKKKAAEIGKAGNL